MDLYFCLHLKSSQSSIQEYILVLMVSPRMWNIIPLIRCCWLTERFHVGLAFHNRPFVVALFSISHIFIGPKVCNIGGQRSQRVRGSHQIYSLIMHFAWKYKKMHINLKSTYTLRKKNGWVITRKDDELNAMKWHLQYVVNSVANLGCRITWEKGLFSGHVSVDCFGNDVERPTDDQWRHFLIGILDSMHG